MSTHRQHWFGKKSWKYVMTPNMISMFYTDVAHIFCLFVTNEWVASCFTGGKSVGDEPGSMVLGLPLLSSPARWKTRSSRWIWQEKRRLNYRVSSNVSKIPRVRAFADVLSKERCKGKNGVSCFVFFINTSHELENACLHCIFVSQPRPMAWNLNIFLKLGPL